MTAPCRIALITAPDSRLVDEIHASPNIEARAGGQRPSLLIMHYTGMASAAKAVDWLSRPESKVSCHYVVDERGRITQMVAEAHRAWHAGVSSWHGECDINSASIGIEIHNPGHDDGYPDFTDAQMDAVARLAMDIARRNALLPQAILAHSDVAPRRKIDPGEKFDWAGLSAQGIGHWVPPARVEASDEGIGAGCVGPPVSGVQDMLRRYGYGVEVTGAFDATTEFAVKAFQRHFRPARVDGRIDRSTLVTLERLIDALPAPTVV